MSSRTGRDQNGRRFQSLAIFWRSGSVSSMVCVSISSTVVPPKMAQH